VIVFSDYFKIFPSVRKRESSQQIRVTAPQQIAQKWAARLKNPYRFAIAVCVLSSSLLIVIEGAIMRH